MGNSPSTVTAFHRNWRHFLLFLGNLLVLGRYMLISVPVLFAIHEMLAGSSEWPPRVIIGSSIALVVSLTFLLALFGIWPRFGRSKPIVVACLVALSVMEFYESIMLHITYGPMQAGDVSAYIYGPLLLTWAVVNLFFFNPRKAQVKGIKGDGGN